MYRTWGSTSLSGLRSNRKFSFVCVVVLAMVLVPRSATAQSVYWTILGTVTDPTGAVVPGVKVSVTNVGTGVIRTFRTNEVGIYIGNSLIPGVYKVEAEAPGFKTGSVSGINLEVNAKLKVDVILQVGTASQVVNVRAEAALLNTQQSTLGQTVDQKMVSQLPIQGSSGRTFFTLIGLSAGVTTQKGEGGYDFDNLRINGGRPRNEAKTLHSRSSIRRSIL